MSQNNHFSFIDQLAYFGGNISGHPENVKHTYQDLELFVIRATLHMSDDIRITHCFLTWLSYYGDLLSPAKMRRLLKTRPKKSSQEIYNSQILGAFLNILKDLSLRKYQWNIIDPFIKKTNKQLLFPELPQPKSHLNPYFEASGIITHTLPFDFNKFIIDPAFTLKNCQEIKYRASDLDPVPADLRAYLEKSKPSSLYEVAKATHHFRAQIYWHYRYLSHFGICDGLLLPKKQAA